MSARKAVRHAYHVTYHAPTKRWVCTVNGALVEWRFVKGTLVSDMANLLEWAGRRIGQNSELVIHTRKRIGTGPSSRRTYPRASDPRGTRG